MKKINRKSNTLKSFPKSWDEIWNSYDRKQYEYQLALEENRVRWQKIQQIILEKFGSFLGLNCIEIGAGSGHYSMLFTRRGANVTLLDYSKRALEFSQNVFRDQGISKNNVQFIHMDALEINQKLLDKYDVSMSFGVAEHFEGINRRKLIKSHYDVLKNGGITFISVPHANCVPFRIYQFIMRYKKRNIVECYPYSMREFKKLATECNIRNYFFIGSSYIETYNPFSFYKRKKRLMQDITKIKKEKPSFFDKYLGREIAFVAIK